MFAGEALKAVAHLQDDHGRPARSLDVAEYWNCGTADATNALYRCNRSGLLLRRRAWVGISRYEYILTEKGRRELRRWEDSQEHFDFPADGVVDYRACPQARPAHNGARDSRPPDDHDKEP